MPVTKHALELVAEATARIRTYSVSEAIAKLDDPNVTFVDIRDPRELERDGIIPGSFHAPRGMLEFWVDPQSPYFRSIFAEDREFILYCGGGWRSALATAVLIDMGFDFDSVAHVDGGFASWKDAAAPIVPQPVKAPRTSASEGAQ
jgi:rhodanese-related sulfurtransferase